MPSSPEELIQRAVHAIETGELAPWIRRTLVLTALFAVALIYMYNFRGLASSQAIDQAQIGRALASGHGWHTNVIRPAAIGQLQAHRKNVLQKIGTDTYHAPLPPLVDAVALFPVKSHVMGTRELVYIGDKAIALMSIALFFASVAVLFFTVRRLFDQRLALMTCGMALICDLLWQYSLTGLPQMLLLLLFNATIYAVVRAVEAKFSGDTVGPWLAAVGVGFGFMALTHALTIWMCVAGLIFCVFFFRPRGWAAAIVLAAFLIVYTPWLLRTFIVCGNPAGLAIYSALDGVGRTEAGWMRQMSLDLGGASPGAFRDKVVNNFISQTGRIFEYLGWSVVALSFFGALLHRFRRREANAVRWFVLALWAGAVMGMAVFGLKEEQGFGANQLHVLFIPLMSSYGLAYLLVQWNRLGIDLRFARLGFISGLFFLCGIPMMLALYSMLFSSTPPLRWPPYIPPAIALLNTWMRPEEIVASDMPWAIAWYGNRRGLWVPENPQILSDLADYNTIGGPVNGLYLTPISGSQNKLGDVVKGEYREWASVIMRTGSLPAPFKWGTVLGDADCVFLSDHDRKSAAP